MKHLEQWLMTAMGKIILQHEHETVDPIMEQSFGYLALQIGLPNVDYLAKHHARKKLVLTVADEVPYSCNHPYINANPTQIPLESQSVDLVILPHILEAHPTPQQILKEVHRILINEGKIIVLGFNPIHICGFRHLYGSPLAPPISYRRQLSQHKVKEWFKLSGFELDVHPFKYTPWFASKDRIYMISARKRALGMHLIGPALVKKTKQSSKAAVVTQQMNKS